MEDSVIRNNEIRIKKELENIEKWWKDERFVHTNRSYSAKDVAVIRPTIATTTPSHYLSRKLYWTLRRCFNQGACSNTFGALDNIQAITMSKHLSSIKILCQKLINISLRI